MTRTSEPKPHDDGAYLFDALSSNRIDPLFLSMRDDIKDEELILLDQHKKGTLNPGPSLERLDNMLDEVGQWGQAVRLSGRIRYLSPDLESDAYLDDFRSSHRTEYDIDGAYHQVVHEGFVIAGFCLPLNENREYVVSDTPRIGMLLALIDGDADSKDTEVWDAEFIVFPDDVEQLSFATPSQEYVNGYLKYHYPELWRNIVQNIPDNAHSEKSIATALRRFICHLDSHHASDIPLDILVARTIYNRIDFDNYL